MGERTGYAAGTFCWTDLGTSDADGAKAFYEGLFGWEPDDVAVGEGSTYTMMRVGSRAVCALYRQMAEAPPAWLSYVAVDDADAAAALAGELGGSAISEPLDVMEAGRMAVLADPQGAVFGIWQAGESFGAELVNDPGAMCLNQLNTSEPEDARRYYGELFGWRFEAMEGGEVPYWGIYNDEALNGGMMSLPVEGGSPHWLVYFTSAQLDGSVETIGELDGGVLVSPMAIPGGRIAVARDPQGAVFALFEGRVDP